MKTHHIWCNYFTGPVEGCKMCERFWKLYPYDEDKLTEEAVDALLKTHFPDVKRLN